MIFKLLILIAVVAAILLGWNIQYKLLYYPGSSQPSKESLNAGNVKPWRSHETDYRGLVALNESGLKKGTVVVFHGNGGSAADRSFYVKALGTLGYRVILAEYPRYGGRKGELGEKAFVDDAIETLRLAFEEYGGPLFILGESMGCGVAAAAAGKTSIEISGIILITPWDTLESVAQAKFPFLPVRLLLKDKYDNIDNLRSFKGRITVIGAELDETIPITHARNLYNSLSGTTRRMLIIQGAGHNDWFVSTNMQWWEEIVGFIADNKKDGGFD